VHESIRVFRKRLPRVMREYALLSPHRPDNTRRRQITTSVPNVMWPLADLRSRAFDATRITTIQDGKVWLFGVAEHWNAEFLGWHVTKAGTRFEATQALGMALRQQFGHLCAEAARGLALRHDHASTFIFEHFRSRSASGASRRATPSSASPRPMA
jgi:hypothetical protein